MFNHSLRNIAAAALLGCAAAVALVPASASAHMGGFGGGHFGGGHFGGGFGHWGHWGGGYGHWGHGWGHRYYGAGWGWGHRYYGAGYGGCWKHFNYYGELVVSCY